MTITANPGIIALLGTPNFEAETRSDFNDLTAGMPKRYVAVSDHTRIVAGADDLVHPNAGSSGGGVGRSAPIPHMGGHAVKSDDDDTLAPRDLRTERQIETMYSLVNQLRELDAKIGQDASDYTARMTDGGKWTPGRGGNASDWIGRMIAKVRELRAAQLPEGHPIIVEAPTENVQHNELYVHETKTGKPMPTYYALRDADGTVKFYRVKAGTKPGWWWIDAQASDEFHPVRSVGIKNRILRDIIAAGVEASMRLYGQEIGYCGRCFRTLTDETSRARGIGPDCEERL